MHIYEHDARMTVDRSPKAIHYFEWYGDLIVAYRGVQIKLDRLASVFAADQPFASGRTSYRNALTGQVHHWSRGERIGVHVKTFAALPPRDRYAEAHGYRSACRLVAIVLVQTGGNSSATPQVALWESSQCCMIMPYLGSTN